MSRAADSAAARLRLADLGTADIDAGTVDGWRDPSNTSRAFREARDAVGFSWVTSHVFRKTCATILDEAGLSARAIADQLGHARPSMTQDVYMARISPTRSCWGPTRPGCAERLD